MTTANSSLRTDIQNTVLVSGESFSVGTAGLDMYGIAKVPSSVFYTADDVLCVAVHISIIEAVDQQLQDTHSDNDH